MNSLGLRGRVLVALTMVTIFAVGSFYVVAVRAIRGRDLHVELLELQGEAAILSAQLARAGAGWHAASRDAVDVDHSVSMYDRTGRLVSGDGPVTGDEFVVDALTHGSASGPGPVELVATDIIGDVSNIVGVIRIAETRAIAAEKTNRVLWLLALFATGLVAASAVIGWLLMRPVNVRFQQLHASALQIGAGDFAAAVPTTGLPEFDRVGGALNQTATRLGAMVERERAFAAAASHQLRTPIASLRVAIEAELLDPQADTTIILHSGLGALDRLDGTVTSLLDLARDSPNDRGILDLPRAIRLVSERWRQPAATRGRSIVHLPAMPQAADIRASAAAVQHVLDVLVDNALLHGSGAVTISGDAVEGGYAVRVSDEGTLPVDTEALFRRRSPGHSTTKGRGIGLALARTLAAAEGARLHVVRSAPATFELLFVSSRSTPDSNGSSGD